MIKALLGVLLLLPAVSEDPTFTLSGTVTLPGPVPVARPNKRLGGDPPCCALHANLPPLDDLVVDGNGGVRWAFVYIKKGLEGKEFEPPRTPVTIDQQGCLYTPHVAGAQVGQLVNFHNADLMLHNVHGLPFSNKEFNFGQPPGALSGVRFTVPEVPIKVVCNVHTWMGSFVCVVDHPFFAVTDAAGKFEIKNLPPGTYTVGVWHEGLKAPDQPVTVTANQTVNFALN
jgi:plastocyanin